MKLGIHIVDTNWEGGPSRLGPLLGEIVDAAEAAGFDWISVADHLWMHPTVGGPLKNHIEAYTTLGFIAAHTRRVRLLALATAVSYRPAGPPANSATTPHGLSCGRAGPGTATGGLRREAGRLGAPAPAAS